MMVSAYIYKKKHSKEKSWLFFLPYLSPSFGSMHSQVQTFITYLLSVPPPQSQNHSSAPLQLKFSSPPFPPTHISGNMAAEQRNLRKQCTACLYLMYKSEGHMLPNASPGSACSDRELSLLSSPQTPG